MTSIDPIVRLSSTYAVNDLADLVDGDGPFATAVLPAPSEHADSDHRLSVRWGNARRELSESWDEVLLDAVDERFVEMEHDDAEAFVVVQRADGHLLIEQMVIGVERSATFVGEAPRLIDVLEHRQRTLPHLVVVADRLGADIDAFDGGRIVATDDVEGDSEHIGRVHAGGWSQRRYQQRAENTWEQNASDVADAVASIADKVNPVLVAIAGDVRAKRLVAESLPIALRDVVSEVDAGSADGIVGEVLRLLADAHTRLQLDVLERFRSSQHLVDAGEIAEAVGQGRVSSLLVSGSSDATKHVDSAIVDALRTSTPIIVVPTVSELSDGLAAITHW